MANNDDKVAQLLASRNSEYRDAWAKTGVLLRMVADDVNRLLKEHPQMFLPYVTIMCKLLRILGSPTKIDHWEDIAGYAKLVADDLHKNETETGQQFGVD